MVVNLCIAVIACGIVIILRMLSLVSFLKTSVYRAKDHFYLMAIKPCEHKQCVTYHRHSICSSSCPSFLPPGQKLMYILEPSSPLGLNSFLRDEDKKEKLKGPAQKTLPGRRKFIFLGIIFLLGTLVCSPLFLQMHCCFFTSRQRQNDTDRGERETLDSKEMEN